MSLDWVARLDTKQFDKSIDQLKIKLESVRASAQREKDPWRLVEYNKQAQVLEEQIAKMARAGSRGYDDLGNAIQKPMGQLEKLIALQKIYANGAATTGNPELIAKYNAALQRTELQINRTRNIGKTGFNEVGDAVKRNTGLLGGMWSGLKTVANILPGLGIAGLLAFAIEPLMNYLSGLDLLKKKTDEAAEARRHLANVALTGNQNAQAELTTLRTLYRITQDTTISLEKRKAAVDQLQKDYPRYLGNIKDEEFLTGKASDAYQRLTDSILATARARAAEEGLTENERNRQKIISEIVELDEKELKLQEKLAQLDETRRKTANTSAREGTRQDVDSAISANQQAIVEVIGEREKKLDGIRKIEKDNLGLTKFITREIKNGADLTDEVTEKTKKGNVAANARLTLLRQITAITAEYNRKSMAPEEAEIQAVIDKFMKIRAEVVRFNTKNPGSGINIAPLDDLKVKVIADLEYKHGTEKLKIALEESKKLVSDYEQAREEVSSEYADKRYGAELEKAKQTAKDAAAELAKLSAIKPEDLTTGESSRKDFLTKNAKEEEQREKDRYQHLLTGLRTYQQQRTGLTEQFQKDEAALLLNGDLAALEERKRIYQDDLNSLDRANIEKLNIFEDLLKGVDNLTVDNAKKVVALAQAKLEKLIKAGLKDNEKIEEIRKLLNQASRTIEEKVPKAITTMAGQFKGLAGSVSMIDKNFGSLLNTVGDVIGGVGTLKSTINSITESLAELKKEKAAGNSGAESLMGVIGGYASGIGSAIGIVVAAMNTIKGIASLFDKTAEYERKQALAEDQRQNAEEIRIRQIESGTKLMEAQLAVIKDLYGARRLTEYRRGLASITTEYKKQIPAIELLFRRIRQRDEGQNGVPTLNELIASLQDINNNALAIARLRDILAQNITDGNSEAAAQINALLDAAEQYRDTLNSIRFETTGTSFDSLLSEITALFEQGLDPAAKEFGENFEAIIKRSISKAFERKWLEEQLQEFYIAFDKAAADGLTKDEIADLKNLREKLLKDAHEGYKQMQEIAGVDYQPEDSKQDALRGQIKSITTEQADLLNGRTLAVQMSLVNIKDLLAKNNVDYMDMGMQKLRQLERIEYNTRLTHEKIDLTNRALQALPPILTSIDNGVRSSIDAIRANGG